MFLSMLNEREGKNFLELADIAINVDGDIETTEKEVFNTYRIELNLKDYQIQKKSYKDVVTEFKASTKKVKKAILIELAGVLDADDEIDVIEQGWINKLGLDLEFRESEIKKMVRWSQDFNDLLNEAITYINK